MESLLLTIEEARKLVGISRDRAYALVNSGEWPTVDGRKRNRLISRAWLLAKYGAAPITENDSTPEVPE